MSPHGFSIAPCQAESVHVWMPFRARRHVAC